MHDFCKRTQDRGIAEMITRLSSFCLTATRLELRQRYMEEIAMNYIATFKNLLRDESGQDLIEYALVAALIALGAITAMKRLATGISTAFSTISSDLTSAVT
jgi:pilus assembly protein Flp/PilA